MIFVLQNNEVDLSKDVINTSISMSEGDADVDLEGMAGRVAELEQLLHGKEAVVEALHAEIDQLRAEASSPTSTQSLNSSYTQNIKETFGAYYAKVGWIFWDL